ncbi:MAG: hypothetical protein EXR28_15160 [Betaproteobacteria bacterium]|nr:hypothetical protein [Betaproteobacteria bacterium]
MDRAPANSPSAGAYRPRKPRSSPLYQCAQRHVGELRTEGRLQRLSEEKVISRFLKCGDPHHGFARVYCPQCRHDYLLAFSCKARAIHAAGALFPGEDVLRRAHRHGPVSLASAQKPETKLSIDARRAVAGASVPTHSGSV